MHEMVDAFRRFENHLAPQARKFMDKCIDGRQAVNIGLARKI